MGRETTKVDVQTTITRLETTKADEQATNTRVETTKVGPQTTKVNIKKASVIIDRCFLMGNSKNLIQKTHSDIQQPQKPY